MGGEPRRAMRTRAAWSNDPSATGPRQPDVRPGGRVLDPGSRILYQAINAAEWLFARIAGARGRPHPRHDRQGRPRRSRPRGQGRGALPARRWHGRRVHGAPPDARGSGGRRGAGRRRRARREPPLGRAPDAHPARRRVDARGSRGRHAARRRRRDPRRGRAGAHRDGRGRRDLTRHATRGGRAPRPRARRRAAGEASL